MVLKKYKDLKGNSGITHYKVGKNYVVVKFKNKPDVYAYIYSKVAKHHVDQMKVLAVAGEGLGTYINRHPIVKNNFVLCPINMPLDNEFPDL
jgi:hypothetical protein